jgi:hypothetical protein
MLKSYQHDKEDSQQNLETKCPPVVGNDSLDLCVRAEARCRKEGLG